MIRSCLCIERKGLGELCICKGVGCGISVGQNIKLNNRRIKSLNVPPTTRIVPGHECSTMGRLGPGISPACIGAYIGGIE